VQRAGQVLQFGGGTMQLAGDGGELGGQPGERLLRFGHARHRRAGRRRAG
jgi:hypothetical protein